MMDEPLVLDAEHSLSDACEAAEIFGRTKEQFVTALRGGKFKVTGKPSADGKTFTEVRVNTIDLMKWLDLPIPKVIP